MPKTISNRLSARGRFEADRVTFLIEWSGRIVKTLFEAALLCILGTMVFAAFGTALTMIGAILGYDWPLQGAAGIGWIVGCVMAAWRSPSNLRKPFGQPIEPSQSSEFDDSQETVQESGNADTAPGGGRRWGEVGRAGAMGSLLGGIAGIGLAIFLTVICVAVLLSPFAPRSWKQGFRAQVDEIGTVSSQGAPASTDSSPGVGASFWHPMFGPIVLTCVGSGALLGGAAASVVTLRESSR